MFHKQRQSSQMVGVDNLSHTNSSQAADVDRHPLSYPSLIARLLSSLILEGRLKAVTLRHLGHATLFVRVRGHI